jgi:hypothetical protein
MPSSQPGINLSMNGEQKDHKGKPSSVENRRWALVAHACNPSYSGGRDQEDHGSKPAPANSSQNPILKKPITKRAGGMAQVLVCLHLFPDP